MGGPRIDWRRYLPEIVAGLRQGEGPKELADRINRTYHVALASGNIITAMSESPGRGAGPLARLLREQYASESVRLFRTYREKRASHARHPNGALRAPTPRWERKLSCEQREAFAELCAEAGPETPPVFRCSVFVLNPRTDIEEKCGRLGRQPFCAKHRIEGRRLLIAEIVNSVRRIA